MNKETRRIREKNENLDNTNLPRRIINSEYIFRELNLSMSECLMSEGDLNKQIESIVGNIYYLLSAFAEMNVDPDKLLKIYIKYSVQQDNYKPSVEALKAIRVELEKMKDPNYFSGEEDIEEIYNQMVRMFDKFHIERSKEPRELSHSEINKYTFMNLDRVMLCDYNDIVDDAYYLIEMLYNDLSTLVKMGVNPKEYLDNMITEKEENHAKGR